MRYITSADLQALLREGKKELVLGEQDKLTDVVREMLRHYGIRIVHTGTTSTVGSGPQAAVFAPPVSACAQGLDISTFAETGTGLDYDLAIINGIVVLPESLSPPGD